MPLAVLGGSFDPVHNGHVAMAGFVLDNGLASEVVVVPAFCSPFKWGTTASSEDRLVMTRMAFSSCPDCRVDDREIRRRGPSYMVETLEELRTEQPNRSLRLIVGADNLDGFSKWHRPEDILALAKILVLGRHGHSTLISPENREAFQLHPGFDQRVSSTEIRVMLAASKMADDLLPVSVARYIRQNGLYL